MTDAYVPLANHKLVRKPPGAGGGHTPGVGWMCTGCEWRFSYDVPQDRALSVWCGDSRHKPIIEQQIRGDGAA